MRGRGYLVAWLASVTACAFDPVSDGEMADISPSTGTGSPAMGTSQSSDGNDRAETGSTPGTATSDSTSAPTTTSAPSGSEDPTDAGSGGYGSTTGPGVLPESCLEIRLRNGNAPSGLYEIAPPGATLPTPFTVYCDMDTDDGGWTLVGRSVSGGFDQGSFGWSSERGDIEDTSKPYSLNARSAAIEFSQVLVGNRGTAYDWGSHVYRFDVPPGFIDLGSDAVETIGLTTIVGDCEGPNMLEWVGHTDDSRVFFLRDTSTHARYGLWHHEYDMHDFNSGISPCGHGADLHEDDGMIMVR